MEALSSIARTVLYEGYLLWPYRRSALKNRQRWTLGGVYPRRFCVSGGAGDRWRVQAECLVEGGDGVRLEVRVRFLQVVERGVARYEAGRLEPVDELLIGGELFLAWDEATEREVVAPTLHLSSLGTPLTVPVEVAAGRAGEWLKDTDGARAGAVVRAWRALRGEVQVRATRLRPGIHRVRVRVVNATPWAGGDREDAQRQAFVSAHVVLSAEGGAFVSLTDPPEALRADTEGCRNVGLWPVLVGEPGQRDTVLGSPIILPDHPRVAPESPGDLFDGTEIDQLLVLNVLALTDEEKAEVRATDPRARQILDRCESLSPGERARLHGAVRGYRVLPGE